MTHVVDSLVVDLLEWLSLKDRSYEETMDAWRTSCPRLPVWEDATDQGLVCLECDDGRSYVRVTAAGVELLERSRPNRRS
jgi:D-3-phosphoglycerate dehydrogenase